jgi:2-haloacid dehalogenase/putative hydrolase of the HAD superfamily
MLDLAQGSVITFDCYGTLVDWEQGIVDAFQSVADRPLDPAAIILAHATTEPSVQSAGYRSYRDTLAEVARRMAPELGLKLEPGSERFLADSLAGWAPFPDTNPALERLARAGYRLGILSNVDDDLLAATRQQLTVDFELIVTAEQVRSYKPAPAHFLEARRRLGADSWLHAAASWFHDVEPATALSVPVVWVNRTGGRPSGAARPDHVVADMAGLAEWMGAGA